MRNLPVLAVLLIVMAATTPSTASANGCLDIGSRVQLFCDDWLIDRLSGARLVMHSPVRQEVAFTFDAPWERGIGSYPTIIKDGSQYRLYYSAGGEVDREYTCVAFSSDAIHWTRPDLGLFDFEGSKHNNIVWTGEANAYCESHNFSPFVDANPECKPDERYKAVSLTIMVPPGENDRRKVMMGFVSADGIHWKRVSEAPIMTDGSFDSHNTCFWDTNRKKYVCYLRIGREGYRSVALATSTDFLNWTKSEAIDLGKTPLEHFYTNGIEQYLRNPQLYVGFPMRFVPCKERGTVGYDQRVVDGLSDMVFMSSHDGFHWNRQFMEAFVRPGLEQHNWGGAHGNQTPAWHIQQTGPAELSIYWLERSGYYNMWLAEGLKKRPREKGKEVDAELRRGTLRLDGFASVNAGYKGGEVVTKPLKFSGKELALNVATSAVGSVKVEIQDLRGQPVPGFALRDCEPIWGDEIERVVSWKNGADVSKLSGKAVRLRFVLKDADLYSIRFRG